MMEAKRFNPNKITVLIESEHFVTGYASDSFVEIKEDVPRYKKYVDIDGKNIFVKSKNQGAEIRLNLKDNSDSVAFINECIRAIDNNEVSGINILCFDVNEYNDTKSYFGVNCKINIETTVKGSKLQDKTYVFIPEIYYNEVGLLASTKDSVEQAQQLLLNSEKKIKA